MEEIICNELQKFILGEISSDTVFQWLRGANDDPKIFCTRTQFVVSFLTYIRNQTKSLLQHDSNNGPEAQTPQRVSISDKESSINSLANQISALSPISIDQSKENTLNQIVPVKANETIYSSTPHRKSLFQSSDNNISQSLLTDVSPCSVTDSPRSDSMSMNSFSSRVNNSSSYLNQTPQGNVSKRRFSRKPRSLNVSHDSTYDNSSRSNVMLSSFMPEELNTSSSTKFNSSREVSHNNQSKNELNIDDTDSFPSIGVRRRIKPTRIVSTERSTTNFGIKSDKQEQNEAFKVQSFQPKEEALDFEKERNILKKEKDKLLEKFQSLCDANPSTPNEVSKLTPKKASVSTVYKKPSIAFETLDPAKISHVDLLNTLAELYCLIMDLNLVSSISSELYFIISLISAQEPVTSDLNDQIIAESLLSNVHNCIYFALTTLEGQKSILEFLLDKNDLRHLYENERIVLFAPSLADYFASSYSHKQNDKAALAPKSEIIYKNVCFMTDVDSKENFPTTNSFRCFKMQRDMFYEIFSYWEKEHATSKNYVETFSAKVRKIITLSCNSTNVAHLARLFREQLIATCIATHKDESDQFLVQLQSKIGSKNISQNKLAMLTNRFTAPPTSTDFDKKCPFTLKEEFFRDFILYSDSLPFQQHLIDSLVDEISRLNDEFSFSQSGTEYKEFVLNVETKLQYVICVKSLCLLSKFLGYLLALPYTLVYTITHEKSYKLNKNVEKIKIDTVVNKSVVNGEITVRNNTQPPIDLLMMLSDSAKMGKLILSVPWIVQLLTLLDHATLQLPYYEKLLRCLLVFCLNTIDEQNNSPSRGTRILLRLVIGYLFDMVEFPQDYYYANLKEPRIRENGETEKPALLALDSLDILDTSVLLEVCPFLRELKMLLSMCIGNKRQNSQKYVRHITPVTSKFDDINHIKKKEKQLQVQMEEWFLRSYPSSVGFAVQVVSERIGSILIKLAKAQIDGFEEKIVSALYHVIVTSITNNESTDKTKSDASKAYDELLKNFKLRLEEAGGAVAKERSEQSLKGLLPPGIPLAAQKKLVQICVRKAKQPFSSWLNSHKCFNDLLTSKNVNIDSIFSTVKGKPEIFVSVYGSEEHKNIFRSSIQNVSQKTEIVINSDPQQCFDDIFISPTNIISNIKEVTVECLVGNMTDIDKFKRQISPIIDNTVKCFQNSFTQSYCKKVITQLTLDLTILLIALHPTLLDDDYLEKVKIIWTNFINDNDSDTSVNDVKNFNDKEVKHFADLIFTRTNPKQSSTTTNTPTKDPEDHTEEEEYDDEEYELPDDESLEYFNSILCPRNIMFLSQLNPNNNPTWTALTKFIVFLLKNNFTSEGSITNQCLSLYKQDWPQSTLEGIAECMKKVTKSYQPKREKFTLFLDFLSEFCVNLHNELDFGDGDF